MKKCLSILVGISGAMFCLLVGLSVAEEIQLRATLAGHTDWAWRVAISPNGKLVASAGKDKKIKWWDMETGKNSATLDGHSGEVCCLAFSPDGKTLASGSAIFHRETKTRTGEIMLWDVPRACGHLSRKSIKGNDLWQ